MHGGSRASQAFQAVQLRSVRQFPTASRFVREPSEIRYQVRGSTGKRVGQAASDADRRCIGQAAGAARRAPPSARRGRLDAVRRVRMDFERYRQSEAAEQAEGLRRQVQSEILTDEQTHVKLCYASIAVELLQERVRSA